MKYIVDVLEGGRYRKGTYVVNDNPITGEYLFNIGDIVPEFPNFLGSVVADVYEWKGSGNSYMINSLGQKLENPLYNTSINKIASTKYVDALEYFKPKYEIGDMIKTPEGNLLVYGYYIPYDALSIGYKVLDFSMNTLKSYYFMPSEDFEATKYSEVKKLING